MELKYRSTLRKISKLISDSIIGLQTVAEIEAVLQELAASKAFYDLANLIAHRFVTMANITDARTWREAASGGSKGNKVFKALRALQKTNVGRTINQRITENAHFIKRMPLDISQGVTRYVSTEVFKGLRSEEIAEALREKAIGLSEARANLIARTESSKAMTTLTEARSKDVGINWYIWKTANDGNRVRESHRHMQDVIVSWDDPPSPEALIGERSVGKYNAGNIYNCRCFPRPLIFLDNAKWPAKVYYNGSIQKMSKLEFEKIQGG